MLQKELAALKAGAIVVPVNLEASAGAYVRRGLWKIGLFVVACLALYQGGAQVTAWAKESVFALMYPPHKILEDAGMPRYLAILHEAAAREYGLDPLALAALTYGESRWVPTAVSRPNRDGSFDCGAAQLNTYTWGACILEPEANLRRGAKYLAEMLRYAEGDLVVAVGLYNVGPSGMIRRNYVANWARIYAILKRREKLS